MSFNCSADLQVQNLILLCFWLLIPKAVTNVSTPVLSVVDFCPFLENKCVCHACEVVSCQARHAFLPDLTFHQKFPKQFLCCWSEEIFKEKSTDFVFLFLNYGSPFLASLQKLDLLYTLSYSMARSPAVQYHFRVVCSLYHANISLIIEINFKIKVDSGVAF